MNKFLTLTKVLIKNGGNPLKSSRSKRSSLNILIVIAAFIPLIASSTFGIIQVYDIFAKLHLEGVILAGALGSASLAMIIFGILYVISIYYFVDDTVQLLTMPLRPYAILGAKFIIVTLFQYFIELITLLPVIIAFGVKINTVTYWIYAVVVFMVLPIIPNVICSLISIIIMAFGKFFRNKDRIKIISGVLVIAFAIGINFGIKGISSNGIRTIADNASAIDRSSMFFPSCKLAAAALLNSLNTSGILNLILFLLVSIAAVIIFLILGEGLYLKGVVGLTQSGSSGKQLSKEDISKQSIKRSQLISFAINEWKTLYRTPAYLLNCVLYSVLFPPMFIVIYKFSSGALSSNIPSNSLVLGIASTACILICSFNMVCATAVSREGNKFFISRYIPVPFKTQVLGKLIPGVVMSCFSLVVIAIMSLVLTKFSFVVILMVFLISIFGITAFNAFGLFIDINFPMLEWDDETKAVKQNFNVGIQSIVTIIICGFLILPLVLFKLSLNAGFMFLLTAYIILAIVAYMLLTSKGVEIYSNSKNYFGYTQDNKFDKKKVMNLLKKGIPIILISVVVIALLIEFTSKTKIEITKTDVSINTGIIESTSFNRGDITKIYIKETMPKADKVSGFDMGSKKRGLFNVNGMGKGNIYVESDKGPFLFMELKSGFVIINFQDSKQTEQLYNELK